MKYAYVMSHAFSGSTLLAMLLGSHPQIATVGEMTVTEGVDIDSYPCSCGRLIHRCPFWTSVVDGMKQAGQEYDVFQPLLQFRSDRRLADRALRAGVRGPVLEALRSLATAGVPEVRREFEKLLCRNECFSSIVLDRLQRQVFVDISKHPNRALHLKKSAKLDLHIVHLVRDGRAVARSCRKNLDLSIEQGANSWSRFDAETRRLRSRFSDDRWLRLRYEDLCRDPELEMNRLFRFLAVDRDEGFRDFRSKEHHVIGNRMRLQSSSEIRLDDRWKKDLSEEDLREVETIAARTLDAHGYA